MKTCGLLTSNQLANLYEDDQLLIPAFKKYGWDVKILIWDDFDYNHPEADVIIIRNTWDYHLNPVKFINVLRNIAQKSIPLWNPIEIVEWNANKKYLFDLEQKGISIVPSLLVENVTPERLYNLGDLSKWEEFIIKPVYGGTGYLTYKLAKNNYSNFIPEISPEIVGKNILIQQFCPNIIHKGEYSLIYFNKCYSHTIKKINPDKNFLIHEEYGGLITRTDDCTDLIKFADNILGQIDSELLYARIDIVEGLDNELLLMELELIEPCLYFSFKEGCEEDFIKKLEDKLIS